ncbi:hypothetical protein M5X00_30130 [Paenibacillus alvei]|uniref:hypothetical protein n=2 Tax=Paenibacillus alvei TaxID=44250 RepID=UPI0012FB4FF7|nr:hypothetical protein [Paenibacillus alvei]MCY9707432.1 hypothetical protein [Paenibacillus alvei]MCY9733832.1 hypothetical protein [Paenibacillus alvei]MCY9758481.1 hypothetical protein [Paenibacillus alvei]MEC0084222.1 hypothetical protein [Paenibacillus alvei]
MNGEFLGCWMDAMELLAAGGTWTTILLHIGVLILFGIVRLGIGSVVLRPGKREAIRLNCGEHMQNTPVNMVLHHIAGVFIVGLETAKVNKVAVLHLFL